VNVTRSSLARATERIKQSMNPEGNKCKCGTEMEIVATGRSLWTRPFAGGGGEVRRVGKIYCPTCDGPREAPAYGTPIYEDELCEIGPVEPITS